MTVRSAEVRNRALEALRQVAAIGAIADGAGDVSTLLGSASGALLDALADICFFDLRDGDGTVERYVEIAAEIDPAVEDLVRSLAPPIRAFRSGHPFPLALSRGGTVHVEHADDVWRRDAAATEVVDDVWRRVGYHSIVSVPLNANGRAFGVLTLLRTRTLPPFDVVDVAVAEEAGRRFVAGLERLRAR